MKKFVFLLTAIYVERKSNAIKFPSEFMNHEKKYYGQIKAERMLGNRIITHLMSFMRRTHPVSSNNSERFAEKNTTKP